MRWRRLSLVVLALYAAVGFDGLLDYTRPPFAAHTGTMNLTIWSEVSWPLQWYWQRFWRS